MKKFLLLFLAFACSMQLASAQLDDIYLSDEIVLTDNQWHFDDYSVIEARNNNYLVVTPNAYYYRQLPPFNRYDFERLYNERVYSISPYVYDNAFGWYVKCAYYHYFYCPITGVCYRLSYIPVFYNFHYNVYRHRHIDLRYWHWRPNGRYHHLWKPPHHHHPHHKPPQHRPPQNHPRPNGPAHGPNHPPKSNDATKPGGHHPNGGNTHARPATPPSRNGNVSRPASPPRGNGNVSRPASPPSRGSSSARPSSPPSRGSSGVRQSPPSRSSGSSRPSPSRSGSGHSPHRR